MPAVARNPLSDVLHSELLQMTPEHAMKTLVATTLLIVCCGLAVGCTAEPSDPLGDETPLDLVVGPHRDGAHGETPTMDACRLLSNAKQLSLVRVQAVSNVTLSNVCNQGPYSRNYRVVDVRVLASVAGDQLQRDRELSMVRLEWKHPRFAPGDVLLLSSREARGVDFMLQHVYERSMSEITDHARWQLLHNQADLPDTLGELRLRAAAITSDYGAHCSHDNMSDEDFGDYVTVRYMDEPCPNSPEAD